MVRRPSSHAASFSLSVEDVIKQLLPYGSNEIEVIKGEVPNWLTPPLWAPDMFAVVATLAERSGFYAEPGIALSTTNAGRQRKRRNAAEAERVGTIWGSLGYAPREVFALWKDLWKNRAEPVCSGSDAGTAWKSIAMQLLAMSDEACAGVGFKPQFSDPPANGFANAIFVFEEYQASAPTTPSLLRREAFLRFLPNSLTRVVPKDRACVLPKALTPSVGCTLRSITHNLALLPGSGQVSAEWRPDHGSRYIAQPTSSVAKSQPFNLLLIPFPYEMEARDISVKRNADGADVDGYFGVEPNWLPNGNENTRAKKMADFVVALVKAAQHEGGDVHGIVMPETALTNEIAAKVAQQVARRCHELEIFVSGVITGPLRKSKNREPSLGRNAVFVARFENGREIDHYHQAKHHRWRLDGPQITNYKLGHVLDAGRNWWESIDLADRKMIFGLDARQAVIATLVCEDLARFDPVLPVLASVGPNLVIALLMDGPQLRGRWPGRHATVLADDPGSAVLTLTSLGMVRRSSPPPGVPMRDCIALWTERDKSPQELDLPEGHHALLLALSAQAKRQKTLDLRSQRDSGGLVEYRLTGNRAVRLREGHPFSWLQR
ncbi:MAG: hypothetical protein ACK4Y5_07490 [Acetobacteraceae bacterium]|jgi:hypothetical protein